MSLRDDPVGALIARRKVGATASYIEPAAALELQALERVMGGRKGLLGALLHAPPSENLDYVVGLLSDPRNDRRDLAELCYHSRVQVKDLLEAYKAGITAKAHVKVFTAIAQHLPAVVEDVMVRATPHTLTCQDCQGTGSITPEPTKETPNPSPEPCKPCRGAGVIGVRPELDRQKFAAELGGLGKSAAPLVDLSDRRKVVVQDASPQGLAALIGAMDTLLHRRGGAGSTETRDVEAPGGDPPLDGDVVSGDTPSP